jgi:hypothetical protein
MSRLLASLFIVLSLISPFYSSILAQEDEEGFETPESLSGIIVQTASTGEFIDNGDDTYRLILEGVDEETGVFMWMPNLSGGIYSTELLAEEWQSTPDDLAGDAQLELGDMSISMSVTNPVFDSHMGILEYTVENYEITPDDPGYLELPEYFETATLFVMVDFDFAFTWQVDRIYLLEGSRSGDTATCVTGVNCSSTQSNTTTSRSQHTETLPGDSEGALVQQAGNGALQDNFDGTYTLMLEGLLDSTQIIVGLPYLRSGHYLNIDLVDDWTFNEEEIVGTAILQIENLSIRLSVTDPIYYEGRRGNLTLIYTVIIEEVISTNQDSEEYSQVPRSFGFAYLFFPLNSDFVSALSVGRTSRAEDMRDAIAPCIPVLSCP